MGPGMFNGLDTLLRVMMVLSVFGLLAIIAGTGYGLWWLINHVQFV